MADDEKSTEQQRLDDLGSVLDVCALWMTDWNAAHPPDSPNVASFVYLHDCALMTFADEMDRQREVGNVALQHFAYVTAERALIVVGQGPKGAFAFMVPPDGWGWCKPLA